MKKIFTLLVVAVMTLVSSVSATAADYTVISGDLMTPQEFGHWSSTVNTFTFTGGSLKCDASWFQWGTANYTPTADGVLKIWGSDSSGYDTMTALQNDYNAYVYDKTAGGYVPSSDRAPYDNNSDFTGANSGWVSFNLVANHEYVFYFMCGGSCNGLTYEALEDIKLEVSSISPVQGTYITKYTNYSGDLIIFFDNPINISVVEANMVWNGNTYALTIIPVSSQENRLTARFGDVINRAYADGMTMGDDIQIVITNIQSKDGSLIYGEDGSMTLNYKAGAKAMTLESYTPASLGTPGATVLKSYMAPEGTDGVYTFVFSENIGAKPDGLEYMAIVGAGAETTQIVIEAPHTVSGKTLTIDLRGIDFESLTNGEVDWNTAATNPDTPPYIKFWIYNESGDPSEGNGQGNVGSYSFTLKYEVLEPVDIIYEWEPAAGSNLADYSEVNVWINQTPDAIEFDGVVFKYVEGSVTPRYADTTPVVTAIWDGSFAPTVADPYQAINYSDWALLTPGAKVVLSGVSNGENTVGLYSEGVLQGAGASSFVDGTCTFVLTQDMIDVFTATGMQVGGSSFTLTAVSLEYEAAINYTEVLVPFDQTRVEADGDESTIVYATVPDEVKGHACVVQFQNLRSLVDYSIHNEVGVEYTWESNDEAEFTYEPAEGEVASVSHIKIAIPGNPAVSDYDAVITLTNESGDVLFSIGGADLDNSWYGTDMFNVEGFEFDVTPAITAEGTYRLNIPAGLFMFDDPDMQSPAQTIVYNVNTTGISSVVVNEAAVYEVYNLQGIKVLSTTNANQLGTLAKGLYIINGIKTLVK